MDKSLVTYQRMLQMTKNETAKDYKELQQQAVARAATENKATDRHSSASKADVLSKALEEVMSRRDAQSYRSRVVSDTKSLRSAFS